MPRKKQVEVKLEKPTTPHIDKDNKIVIPVDKGIPFKSQITYLLGRYDNMLDKSTKEVFNSFLDVGALQKAQEGTRIPFIATIYGGFIINPSTVNISTYQKMWQTHDVIRRCTELNQATIVDGVGEYYHEDIKKQTFIRRALKYVEGGKDGLIRQALSALWAGHWIGLIHDIKDEEGYTLIKDVMHLPPISTQYTVDAQGDIDNYWQYVYNYPYAGTQNALSTMFNDIGGFFGGGINAGNYGIDSESALGEMDYPFRTNFINTFGLVQLDKKRCVHYAYDPLNGKINPYGYSLYRPLHDLWMEYTVINRLYMSAMARCANPMVIGFADATKVINTPVGEGQITAVDAMYRAMQAYTEESAIVLPGLRGQLFDIEVVHNEGNFVVYDTALKYIDEKLEKGLKNPDGLFSSSGSYASATAQNSIYTRSMDSIKTEVVQEVLLNQIVKHLLVENFGDNIEDLGRFENKLQNIDDKLKYQKLYEGLNTQGFISNISKTDIQRVRKTCGEPELSEEELEELIELNKTRDIKQGGKDNSGKTLTKDVNDHYTNRSTNENV